MAFHPTTLRIARSITELNAVPAPRRSEDFRIAKGLLEEAASYVKLGDYMSAERMRVAALPYLRFAELV